MVLTFPDKSIFKVPNLVYDFVRGYFDGDGCISFTKTGRLMINIVGTKEFLSEIKNLFPNNFGKALIKDRR